MRVYLTAPVEPDDGRHGPEPDAWILDARATSPFPLPRPGGRAPLYLRTDRLDAPGSTEGLTRLRQSPPAALMLPVGCGADAAQAGAWLAVAEAECGWPDGGTRIVALVETAAGALALPSLVGASPRLIALGWDAAALAAELRVAQTGADGAWSDPLADLRRRVRLTAAAARVEAIEAACPPCTDAAAHVARARRDGFEAVFAADPATVAAIRAGPAALRPAGSARSPRR